LKVLQVAGYKKSGKTSFIKKLIKKLLDDQKRVAVLKNTHLKRVENKETDSQKLFDAGAEKVIITGDRQQNLLESKKSFINTIRDNRTKFDYFIIEGYKEYKLPRIVCLKNPDEFDAELNKDVIGLTGTMKKCDLNNYFPLETALDNYYEAIKGLPDFPAGLNCEKCGMSCIELYSENWKGNNFKCVVEEKKEDVIIKINGDKIKLIPFIKKIAKSTIIGFVKNLKGYKNGKIEIEIKN